MKINDKALIEQRKLKFGIDLEVEDASYSENEFFPKLNEYKEKSKANKKVTTVGIKRFVFTEQSLQIIKGIATKANIVDQELFIKQLQGSVTSELARIKLQNINRDFKPTNTKHKGNLKPFNTGSSSLINSFISLNTESLSYVINNIQPALPFIFNGKLDSFSEDDLLKLLHLLQTSSECEEKGIIDFSRTKSSMIFIDNISSIWERFVPEPNVYGRKALLEGLYNEVYKHINATKPDLRNQFKNIKKLKR